LKCKKLKANQAARTVPKNKKVEESKFQTAQIARTSEIYLFMAQKVTLDLANRWIIDLGVTLPITSRKE